MFILVLPGISRRLHDLNRPLWLASGLWAIYGVVLAIQTTGVFGARRSLAILLSNVPILVLTVLLVLIPGTVGPNRFGEDRPPPGSDSAS